MTRTFKMLALSVVPALMYAGPITANLLTNPGGEAGSLSGWTIGTGTPIIDSGTFDPGINPHTGSFDFAGGHSSPTSTLSQTQSILVSGITGTTVDTGTLTADVSFFEQGLNQGSPSDDGSITLIFLDGSSVLISTATTAVVDSHAGAWTNGTGEFVVPVGTRSITYQMNLIRNQGSDNDSFIDDNVLTISSSAVSGVPEPSTFGLALGALAAGSFFLRRKR